MPEIYLGTVSRPDIAKYYLMRRFKNTPFTQYESVIHDDHFDLFYVSNDRKTEVESAFKDFYSGYERGLSSSFKT